MKASVVIKSNTYSNVIMGVDTRCKPYAIEQRYSKVVKGKMVKNQAILRKICL